LKKGLEDAIRTTEENGAKLSRTGLSMMKSFENALNPTKELALQIEALSKAGKSNADIIAVLGDKIKSFTETAKANGQQVPENVAKLNDLAKAGEKTGLSIESLGKSLIEFARNPIEAAKAGIVGMLEKMGPTAVGLGAIGVAVAAAGSALFHFVSDASDAQEALDNLSTITGMSANDLRALQQIAKEAGLASLDLGRTIGKLNQELGKPEAQAFEKALGNLGIAVLDLNGKQKDAITLLDEVRIKLLAIPDPTERAQKANEVLGGRLRELIPLLLNQKNGLRDSMEETKKYGIALDDVTQKNLRAFDDMMDKVGRTMEAFKLRTVSATMKIGEYLAWFIDPSGMAAQQHFSDMQKQAAASLEEVRKNTDTAKVSLDNLKPTTIDIAAVMGQLTEEQKKLAKEMVHVREVMQDNVVQMWTELDKTVSDTSKTIEKFGPTFRETMAVAEHALNSLTLQLSPNAPLNSFFDNLERKARSAMDSLNTLALQGSKGIIESAEDMANVTDALIDKDIKQWAEAQEETAKIAKKAADVWKNQISTIFTDFGKGIADAIVHWKGFGEALKNTGQEFLTAVVRMFVEKFSTPLMKIFSNVADAIAGLFSGKGFSGFSSILDGVGAAIKALVPHAATAATAVAAVGASAAATTAAVTSTGAAMATAGIALSSGGAAAAGAGAAATTAAGGFTVLGMGLATAIPVFGAIAAGAIALWQVLKHNPVRDFVEEFKRDFGGLEVSKNVVNDFAAALGFTMKQVEGIRKDLASSPLFLTQIAYPIAQAQGKVEEFIASLRNVTTAWGTFNFEDAFKLGAATGDWAALNAQFVAAFGNSQALISIMPDFATKLSAVSTAVKQVTLNAARGAPAGLDAGRGITDTFQPPRWSDQLKDAIEPVIEFGVTVGRVGDAIGSVPKRILDATETFTRGLASSVVDFTTTVSNSTRSMASSVVAFTNIIANRSVVDVINPKTGGVSTDELMNYYLTHTDVPLPDEWAWLTPYRAGAGKLTTPTGGGSYTEGVYYNRTGGIFDARTDTLSYWLSGGKWYRGDLAGNITSVASLGLAKGTDYVPRTGTYMLHQGEAVIPAAQNRGGDTHFHLEGATFYGMDDLDRKIAESWMRIKRGGGFRGV